MVLQVEEYLSIYLSIYFSTFFFFFFEVHFFFLSVRDVTLCQLLPSCFLNLEGLGEVTHDPGGVA